MLIPEDLELRTTDEREHVLFHNNFMYFLMLEYLYTHTHKYTHIYIWRYKVVKDKGELDIFISYNVEVSK